MSHNIGNGFGTKVIHGGYTRDRGYHSLGMPIYQTSTFYFIMKTYLRQGAAELPAADFRAG